jgi:endonuclease G
MKQIFSLIILSVLCLSLNGQNLRDKVKIKTKLFVIEYSEKLEQPTSIQYTVMCPNGTASRSGMDFYTNDSIHTSDNADYANNIYDKGHLAPAADFNCDRETLHQTFSYLNCALQNQYLNRGVWRLLEAQEREWAKQEPVVVVIKLIFTTQSEKLVTGATIPVGFTKTIELKKTKKVYNFYFENIKPTKSTFWDYQVKN